MKKNKHQSVPVFSSLPDIAFGDIVKLHYADQQQQLQFAERKGMMIVYFFSN